jgi:hypothetical protein
MIDPWWIVTDKFAVDSQKRLPGQAEYPAGNVPPVYLLYLRIRTVCQSNPLDVDSSVTVH